MQDIIEISTQLVWCCRIHINDTHSTRPKIIANAEVTFAIDICHVTPRTMTGPVPKTGYNTLNHKIIADTIEHYIVIILKSAGAWAARKPNAKSMVCMFSHYHQFQFVVNKVRLWMLKQRHLAI